jgi:hypothetical protein
MNELTSLISFMDTKVEMLQKAERWEREGKKDEARAIYDEWMKSSALNHAVVMR